MSSMRFADIAVNLTDPMFKGTYHGRTKHPSDIDAVVKRARARGVEKILITGTSLQESQDALELAKKYDFHSTAGVHPTSTIEMNQHPSGPEGYVKELQQLIEEDRGEGGSKRIISIGEMGLDYDRLHHSSSETQLKHLPTLLRLSHRYRLPLFLHSRHPDAHKDLIRILKEVGWGGKGTGWYGGVVHSFTGSIAEMNELVDLGLHIGINGCSLKTAENIEMIKHVPLDRIMLETDAPWCSITSTHASSAFLPTNPESPNKPIERVPDAKKSVEGKGVKGRNEPADIRVIAHVVAEIKGVSVEEVAKAAWENSLRLFWPGEAE